MSPGVGDNFSDRITKVSDTDSKVDSYYFHHGKQRTLAMRVIETDDQIIIDF